MLGSGGAFTFIYYILPKALAEVTVISFLMAAVMGNEGFNNFVIRFFARPQPLSQFHASRSD
jgi:hypothetical protein